MRNGLTSRFPSSNKLISLIWCYSTTKVRRNLLHKISSEKKGNSDKISGSCLRVLQAPLKPYVMLVVLIIDAVGAYKQTLVLPVSCNIVKNLAGHM